MPVYASSSVPPRVAREDGSRRRTPKACTLLLIDAAFPECPGEVGRRAAVHHNRCTRDDAAIYQVSARNGSGMICCSARVEVESSPPQLPPDQEDAEDAGWKRETEALQVEASTGQSQEEEHPYQREEGLTPNPPSSAGSSPPRGRRSGSLQCFSSCDIDLPSLEKPLDSKETSQPQEAYDPNKTEESAQGVPVANSSDTAGDEAGYWPWLVYFKASQPVDGALNHDALHSAAMESSHQRPPVQKYISSSWPLPEVPSTACPGVSAPCSGQLCPQVPSEDSDSDYELCPEITLTYTEEEFSDDDLEYLECSDVMTDYSNAVWQRHLQGPDCVFLLESDDDDLEFAKRGLGGCGHFLSEAGCRSQVSDDTGPMDATPGLRASHSPPQEAGGRSSGGSRPGSSLGQPGMTLILSPHQDSTSMVTDKLPSASGAAENACPGIRGETTDSHQAGEEVVNDNLLAMDKAPVKMTPGEVGAHQPGETSAERIAGGKDLVTARGSQKPVRVRRPWAKGKPEKLTTHLKENAAEGTLNLLHPREPAKHPLTRSDNKRRGCRSRAEAPGPAVQVHAEELALCPEAKQEAKPLWTPAVWLPCSEDNAWLQGEEMLINDQLEASQTADHREHLQVQILQPVQEQASLSPMPAAGGPVVEEFALTGTRASETLDFGGTQRERVPLARGLEVEVCAGSPGCEGQEQDGAAGTPAGSLGGLNWELSISDTDRESTDPREHLMTRPQGDHADPSELEASPMPQPGLPSTVLTLENACGGLWVREAVGDVERFEPGDRGACWDSTSSPTSTLGDEHLPPEMCSLDLELADGWSRGSDLHCPEDKIVDVVGEPSWPTCENSEERDSGVPPLFVNTLTWKMSPVARGGVTEGGGAEVEKSTCRLACVRRTDQDRLDLSSSRESPDRQLLPSEDGSSLQVREGGVERPSTSATDTTDATDTLVRSVERPSTSTTDATDTTAGLSYVVMSPQETATFPVNTEGLSVSKDREDTSAITTAVKVHPAKYFALSIAENSREASPKASSPQESGKDLCQLSSSAPWGHILNDSTTESVKELASMAPNAPGTQACLPQRSEGGSFWSESPLQIGHHSGDKNQMMDRADHRSLDENFQEKGSETKQKFCPECLPHQGSLFEDDFQESLPATSAAQEETGLESLDQSPGNSGQATGQGSGLGTRSSAVAEAIVEEHGQALSDALPLSEYLLEEAKEYRPGAGDPGSMWKILTLEASVAEPWPPRQLTDSECEDSGAVPRIPDGAWAGAEVLKAGALLGQLDSSEEAAPASGPQCGFDPSLAQSNRESHEWKEPVSSDDGSSLSPQYLNQLGPLESSVDPVSETDSCCTDSETSRTAGKGVNSMSQNQEGNQLRMAHPTFLRQWLSSPQILESSVDPIDEVLGPPTAAAGLSSEKSQLKDGDLDQRVEVQPTAWQVSYPEQGGESIPSERSADRNQDDHRRWETPGSKTDKAEVEVQCPDEGVETVPSAGSVLHVQGDGDRRLGEAAWSKAYNAGVTPPTLPLSSSLTIKALASVGDDTNATGQNHDAVKHDAAEPSNHQCDFSGSEEKRVNSEDEGAQRSPPSGRLTRSSLPSSPGGSSMDFSISNSLEEPNIEDLHCGETQRSDSPGSPATPETCESAKAPKFLQDPCPRAPTPGSIKKPKEEETSGCLVTKVGKFPGARPTGTGSEEAKKKQDSAGSGYIAEGVKKKILSRVAALRLRLEEKENLRKTSSFLKKIPKLEASVSHTDEKKDHKKPPCKREGKAPELLKKIQAEMFPDHSGNIRLSCQFAEIHEDSTIWWTKDAKPIAQVQRSAGDHSMVSLAIVQAGQKDQGHYYCCIKNSYGKVTTDFNLTAEVLRQLSSHQDVREYEEIEFSQLIFKEDFLSDSYFGGSLRGQIATEELHFGEGVHRKAFRSTVMRGLTPVFKPGHACVLKVHNAIAYGTRNNDELVQRNYKLAAQECYVQNTARHYAKIYAAEAQPLEGFGEVPEIIPIFLIHRPENNIPYATVEEELIGEFVKYSIRDGKEINFLRRESEAGQKCCTFQHWVYQKTSGCLLVTDMQGVGMKLTDVGIATLAKGYKGFKGNCSMTFIDQFKALHQCNKYCKMLGLKALQSNYQKQKKPSVIMKSKVQPNATPVKKAAPGTPAEKKT
ncbi:PREDICTED: alpha-protein kinase 2 [Elephantulus edwardii]|uniref:alpha-protein kinase 2 n=1 Tax=Elephantulus edwardii TaxID=28737 RepID=UPI0003F0AA9E|nr:PREDICTED: alpha-protein kinase 2 [Elephantulus edwardii]